jgi:hypothetical protein
LSSDLHGDSVGETHSRSPISSADRDNVDLGNHQGTSNGDLNLLRALVTVSKVTVEVTNTDEGLEAGSLTSGGLLLDRHNLHDLILKVGEEEVNNLVLLDGHGEEEDLLELLDLSSLDETT